MCNRICLSTGIAGIADRFEADDKGARSHQPHWNLGPGQALPVVRYRPFQMGRHLDMMRWGLIPSWAHNSVVVCYNIDARTSGADARMAPSVMAPYRRCLIPADSFYEWRISDRQPFAVALENRRVMALAGLWDLWVSPTGEQIGCFAVLTTDPNERLAPLCKRMPVIVFPEDWDMWLGKNTAGEDTIRKLLKPCASDRLSVWPIDRRVANRNNDDPRLLEATAG